MKEKITMLTCYDYCTAKIIDGLVDYILVGDSLDVVIYGQKNTKKTNMSKMLAHVQAVARGASKTYIIADMPINSYKTSKQAIINAGKFIKAGADSVKIEGNKKNIIKALVKNKIKIIGHIGLLPQTTKKYKIQGRQKEEAEQLIKDAVELATSGCHAIVLECVPEKLAKRITDTVKIPIIGIGAGKYCDGQVLVINDILGLYKDKKLKFVKQYTNLAGSIRKAVRQYSRDVKSGKFPTNKHSFK